MFVWDGGATYLYLYLPAASVFEKYEKKNGTLARLGLLAQSAFACRRLPWRRVLPGLVRGARGTSAADGI